MKRVVLNIHERQEEEDYQGFSATVIFVSCLCSALFVCSKKLTKQQVPTNLTYNVNSAS